jgi:16S rRNA C967 or C1407 C5-methylase (RsmB/RsmF family)/NOL1/NOP2/fmu family ribosome biogenesis protein
VHLPEKLLQSLEGIKGFDRTAFEEVHVSGRQITSIRINPLKILESSKVPSFGGDLGEASFIGGDLEKASVPWTNYGHYLNTRPSFTFDPLFHAGCYYVQEASSMFLEQALRQTTDLLRPLKVLDLSAAPGGKSTHIQSLISKNGLLVSNEVIRSRANILKDNVIKWGCENIVVTNNDPKDFSKLENYFDVIVIDAPCSGSGLFRREPGAIQEWSEDNVTLCSRRQQRIIADILPALKKNGILIYSTCSYSKEEDEDIMDWMIGELSMVNCQLSIDKEWNITETQATAGNMGYRFWPDKVKGEGFFIACFRKTDGEEEAIIKIKLKAAVATKKEIEITEKWVKGNNHGFIKYENTVYAWPKILSDDMNFLLANLRVIYSGVRVGELIRDKLVPDHALAMSKLVNDSVKRIELDHEQAIQYLQRKELTIEVKEKGWQLVNYQGHSLGWVNALPNRINNYYPKELRILKEK